MSKEYFDLKELDDAVLRLAALGLLEIAGKSYKAEFDASYPNKIIEMPSADKIDQIERAIKREERREKLGRIQRSIVPLVTKAAVVFFVFFLGFSTVLITSADAREFFYQLVFTVHERYSEVVIPEDSGSMNNQNQHQHQYEVSYIPKGYQLVDEKTNGIDTVYTYIDENSNPIIVSIFLIDNTADQTMRFDTENADSIQTVNINKSMGIMIVKGERLQIVWQDSIAYFSVTSKLPIESTLEIAESIKKVE